MGRFLGVDLPNFNNPNLDTEAKLKAVINAVYALNDKLVESLNSLNQENFSSSYEQSAGSTATTTLAREVAELKETVKQMKSYMDANSVNVSGPIKAINESTEKDADPYSSGTLTRKISPDKIELIGYGGDDDQFKIRELAIIRHPTAIIGNTLADDDSRIAGGSYAVGNMVFNGETIDHAAGMPSLTSAPNLKINGGNLDLLTTPAGTQYFLGIDAYGHIRAFSAAVVSGVLTLSDAGSITMPSIASRTVNTIQSPIPESGLIGYRLPDVNSDDIGGTFAGAEYIYTAHVGEWYYITHRVEISSGNVTAKYDITPCWIKPYEGEYATYSRDCTL